ncbi:hypothetical protein ACFL17_04490 [Pseudomonadota bacterium]
MVRLLHIVVCIVVLTIGGTSTDAIAKISHKIYLTSIENNGIPDTKPQLEFTCSDKIYAVIEVSGLSKKKHQLEAVWTDPKGKKRERTAVPLYVSQAQTRTWVWLKLHPGAGASVISAFDPAYGLEEFIGQWSISIFIDRELLDKKQFSVLC